MWVERQHSGRTAHKKSGQKTLISCMQEYTDVNIPQNSSYVILLSFHNVGSFIFGCILLNDSKGTLIATDLFCDISVRHQRQEGDGSV
jgi:hypothetical protein